MKFKIIDKQKTIKTVFICSIGSIIMTANGMMTEKIIMETNGKHTLLPTAKCCLMAFTEMVEKSHHRNFFSLHLFKQKLDSAETKTVKEWLCTEEGFNCLIEVIYNQYREQLTRAICAIKIGLYIRELTAQVIHYLDKNPDAKIEVEKKYFHHLLKEYTTVRDIEYYHGLGLSFSGKDEQGVTWFLSAVSSNALEAVSHFVAQKDAYKIDIMAFTVTHGNALSMALMATDINLELIKILWKAGIVLPEHYLPLLINVREMNPSLYSEIKQKMYNNSCIYVSHN